MCAALLSHCAYLLLRPDVQDQPLFRHEPDSNAAQLIARLSISAAMSLAFITMTMLLGTSVVVAFVLHPSKEEPAAAASLISHHRSIRKDLLNALNMQTEPRLPAGGLDSIREQWKKTSSAISPRASRLSGYSESPDSGNKTCCSTASEVFMKDLGWDSWVIHPLSLTIVQCALCNSAVNAVQCPSSRSTDQNPDSQDQVPCCQPTSQETVPIVYMDESSSIVISSVQLARGCGFGPTDIQQPSEV
ncbi:gonadal somatic cell derived factor isoform X2 [Mugil cephalus]|uniref:gonadal somatic cell derived factor isoform X2 n=1 Tax=Mugil cephalus TaxID=48193 RepID=UPI001FB668D2|nr:gonadal somatic cell derived factor isoform X2 [Mugil cephalus]